MSNQKKQSEKNDTEEENGESSPMEKLERKIIIRNETDISMTDCVNRIRNLILRTFRQDIEGHRVYYTYEDGVYVTCVENKRSITFYFFHDSVKEEQNG